MITLHGDTRAHFVAAEWQGSDFGSFRPCQRDERAEEDSRQREGRVRTSGCNTAEHVQAVTDLGGGTAWMAHARSGGSSTTGLPHRGT